MAVVLNRHPAGPVQTALSALRLAPGRSGGAGKRRRHSVAGGGGGAAPMDGAPEGAAKIPFILPIRLME
jgi:hypothetical protein